MNNQQLRERVKRLEDALALANKPYHDSECDCCGEVYIGYSYEDIRCFMCCSTCYYDRNNKVWVKGHMCPSKRRV